MMVSQKPKKHSGPQHKISKLHSNNRCNRGLLSAMLPMIDSDFNKNNAVAGIGRLKGFPMGAHTPWTRREHMNKKPERDVEKSYPLADFIAKLRRLADSLEKGEQFEIHIAGERIYVPVRARYTIEHEREDGLEEIEFQIKWSHGQ